MHQASWQHVAGGADQISRSHNQLRNFVGIQGWTDVASEYRGHNMDDNKKRALSAALGQIERQFGKGSIMRMGDNRAEHDIAVISTGSLGLDVALGVGGLPRGTRCRNLRARVVW